MDRVAPRLMIAGLVTIVMGGSIAWTGSSVGEYPVAKGAALALIGVAFLVTGLLRYWKSRRQD